jgi:hypothetical protein
MGFFDDLFSIPGIDSTNIEKINLSALPGPIADFIIYIRKQLSLPPITSIGWAFGIVIAVSIVIALISGIVYSFIYTLVMIYVHGVEGALTNKLQIILFCFTAGFILSYFIYKLFVKPALTSSGIDISSAINNKINVLKESFSNPMSSTSLLNIQAVSVKQTAYVGPNENGGTFDTTLGIQSALNAGVRIFTLQIDYLDSSKDSKHFDKAGVPTLLYRNKAGHLISSNGGNIAEVAKSLAAYAFNPSLQSGSYPLVVYLHFVRAPNLLREPEKYVKFLSKVAEDLEPLQEFILKNGNYQRQQNETQILNTTTKFMEGKVIFFSNADTSIFKNVERLGMAAIDQKYDLDYLVNVRVYLENSSDNLGVSALPMDGVIPRALVVSLTRLTSMSEGDKDTFALKGKGRFVFVLPSQDKNPSLSEISDVVTKCGINSIALNLFGEQITSLTAKLNFWNKELFFRVKSPNYQAQLGINFNS